MGMKPRTDFFVDVREAVGRAVATAGSKVKLAFDLRAGNLWTLNGPVPASEVAVTGLAALRPVAPRPPAVLGTRRHSLSVLLTGRSDRSLMSGGLAGRSLSD
jgi:hypothetical protein